MSACGSNLASKGAPSRNPGASASEGNDADSSMAALLSRDPEAWRQFTMHHEPALRRIVNEIIRDRPDVPESETDDIVASFWLRLLDDDLRLLRSFKSREGKALEGWLTLQISEHTVEQLHKLDRSPPTVPLSETKEIAAPEPLIYLPGIFAADATERFIEAITNVYTRRLLQRLTSVAE